MFQGEYVLVLFDLRDLLYVRSYLPAGICFLTALAHSTNEHEHGRFNRSEEDFEGDLQAYNDYLEHREDIIYGLCSGVKEEISQAQAKVQQYEDGHRDEITKNAAKK